VRGFTYQQATDVAGAVAALAADPGAVAYAGGTNLVDLMKVGAQSPTVLVDVNHLGLDAVEERDGGGLRIGAGVRNSDLAVHPLVRRGYPVLSQALLAGASGQLRNMATTAGNLLQRTRCTYFMDASKPCNKHAPGTGCPAIAGDHRNLAILGTSPHCIATHPSDMAVAMVALDAVVHVVGPDGERTVPVEDLHRLPGDDPSRDTVLTHGELITAVELPALPPSARSTYRKARDRASFAFAAGSVAAVLDLAPGTGGGPAVVRDVRLGLGAVAHKPWRARAAEQVLRGGPATAEAFGAAAEAELDAARPLPANAFKVPLVRNLVVATLLRLAGQGA
jgi:xanthine dehydrogenase YagS FAD-binding subunit